MLYSLAYIRPTALRVGGMALSDPDGMEPVPTEPEEMADTDDGSGKDLFQGHSGDLSADDEVETELETEVVHTTYTAVVATDEGGGASVGEDSLTIRVPADAWGAVTVRVEVLEAQAGITVTFDPANGEDIFEVKTGENGKVAEPAPPAILPTGMRTFLGWFEEGASDPFDFDQPVTESMKLTARYSKDYYVRFMNANGVIIRTDMVPPGSPVPDPGFDDADLDAPAGMWFSHWFVYGGSSAVEDQFVLSAPLQESVILAPAFTGSHYVQFRSGGSYVDPVLVATGGKAEKPADPQRPGYTFAFWSHNPNADPEDDSKVFDFENTSITESITLYGIWKPETVDYTIVYWVEAPNISEGDFAPGNRDHFIHAAVTTSSGTAGSTVTSADATDAAFILSQPDTSALRYAVLNTDLVDSKTLAGDGTTVINVYYNRIVYDVVFNLANDARTMTYNRVTYDKDNVYVMRTKYEMDITDIWPSQGDDGLEFDTGPSDVFLGWKPVNARGTTNTQLTRRLDFVWVLIPKSGTTLNLTAQYSNNVTLRTMNYHLESLTDDGEAALDSVLKNDDERRDTTGRLYRESVPYSQTLSQDRGKIINSKTLDGFEYVGGNSGKAVTVYHFYYNRLTYDLILNPVGGTVGNEAPGDSLVHEAVKYEEPLEPYQPQDPAREGYTFGGWYTTAEYYDGTRFTFDGAEMPSSNLTLFARWVPTDLTVTVYEYRGAEEQLAHFGVEKLGTVQLPQTLDQYVAGVYTDPGRGQFRGWVEYVNGHPVLFEFDGHVMEKSIVLYGMWDTVGFRVTYDLGEAGDQGTPPEDPHEYDLGTQAVVEQLPDGIEVPDKVFVGWQVNGEGATYYSDTLITIPGDITLVAKFVKLGDAIVLTYDPNYTPGPDAIDQPVERGPVVLLGEETFTRAGHILLGWSDRPGDNSKDYSFHQTIQITENRTLYAVWERVSYTVTFKAGQGGSLNPEDTHEYTDILNGTPWEDANIKEPGTIPDSGYYFTGWDPAIPGGDFPIVEDLVFIAKFATQQQLTIKADDATKMYDGDPLVAETDGWEIVGGDEPGLAVTGITVSGQRTDAGTEKAVVNITGIQITLDGEPVTERYAVGTQDGTLEVTPRPIAITGGDAVIAYDGQKHTVTTYKVEGLLGDLGHEIKAGVSACGEGTLPGEYPVNVTVEKDDLVIQDADGNLVTGNYSYTTVPGNLVITEPTGGENREWSITAPGARKPYSGAEQNHTGTMTHSGLPAGARISGYSIVPAAGTNVGNYFTASYTGFVNGEDANILTTLPTFGTDYTQGGLPGEYEISAAGAAALNYTFQYEKGVLTVVSSDGLTATAEGKETVYDAQAHAITVTPSIPGATIEYRLPNGSWSTTHPRLVAVADSSLVEYRVSLAGYNDVTGKERVTIKPRPITLTADDGADHVFDGSTVTRSTDVNLTDGTIVGGHELSATASGTGTNVGNHKIIIDSSSIRIMAGTDNVTENYAITEEPGSFNITAMEIDLGELGAKVDDKTKTYGTEEDPPFTLSDWPESVVPMRLFDLAFKRDPGEDVREYDIRATITPRGEEGKNYRIIPPGPGTLTITPAVITVTPDDRRIDYGDPAPGYTVQYSGFQFEDTAAVINTHATADSIYVQGDDKGTYSIAANGGAADNYTFRHEEGTLTVDAREITVQADNRAVVYDGNTHVVDTYQEPQGLLAGHRITAGVTAYGSGRYPDTYPVEVTVDNGTLRIENTDGGEVTKNYEVKTAPGELVITAPGEGEKLPWTVEANSGTVTYNARRQEVTGFTHNLPDGYTVDGLTASGAGVDVDTYSVAFSGSYVVYDEADKDVTAYYADPVMTEGELVIEQAELTVTADDMTIVYGAPIPTYTARIDGFEGDDNEGSLTTAPSFTCAYTQGAAPNIYPITPYGAQARNFKFLYVPGELTVLEDDSAMRAGASDITVTYDAQPHAITVVVSGVTDATIEYRLPGGTWSTTHPTQIAVADSSLVEYRVSKEGYTTITGSARVTILPRPITVQAGSATRTYTGRLITVNPAVTLVSGSLVSGQSMTATASGSGTSVGTYPIPVTGTIIMAGSADVTANYAITTRDGTLTIERRTGGGGSDGGGGGTSTPDTDPPGPVGSTGTVAITDETVPLAELPDGLVTIDDRDVPLAGLPYTGGIPIEAFLALGTCLMVGGVAVKIRGRRYRPQKRNNSDS